LLKAKETAKETLFKSILSKEGKCSPEVYKNIERCKGHRENIPAIKHCNALLITDLIEKVIL